jgi:hypothetical protein
MVVLTTDGSDAATVPDVESRATGSRPATLARPRFARPIRAATRGGTTLATVTGAAGVRGVRRLGPHGTDRRMPAADPLD